MTGEVKIPLSISLPTCPPPSLLTSRGVSILPTPPSPLTLLSLPCPHSCTQQPIESGEPAQLLFTFLPQPIHLVVKEELCRSSTTPAIARQLVSAPRPQSPPIHIPCSTHSHTYISTLFFIRRHRVGPSPACGNEITIYVVTRTREIKHRHSRRRAVSVLSRASPTTGGCPFTTLRAHTPCSEFTVGT